MDEQLKLLCDFLIKRELFFKLTESYEQGEMQHIKIELNVKPADVKSFVEKIVH